MTEEEDLRDKGFPFACENCGAKPTPDQVVKRGGACEVCGDTVIAYTIDTAEFIVNLMSNSADNRTEF